ncbi:MAG: IS200/IS605 family transposase [Acidobacteriota bacterium]
MEFDSEDRRDELARLLAEVCNNHDYHLLQHRAYSDHLRCLLSLKPHQAISRVINTLKSNISREFCAEFDLTPPLWATGYLARSVGRARIQAVKQYLANQAEHHGYAKRAIPPVFRYRTGKPEIISAEHNVFDLTHHIVLATRYRRSVFSSGLGKELIDYWLRVARKRGFAIDQATVLPDHAHLLARIAPRMSVEECALSLINNSQHWMSRHHAQAIVREGIDHLWQTSAYAGTCGKVTTAQVKAFLVRP